MSLSFERIVRLLTYKHSTSSRDTQEVPYDAGCEVLRILSSYQSRTSLLQDFAWYEQRQLQSSTAPETTTDSTIPPPPSTSGVPRTGTPQQNFGGFQPSRLQGPPPPPQQQQQHFQQPYHPLPHQQQHFSHPPPSNQHVLPPTMQQNGGGWSQQSGGGPGMNMGDQQGSARRFDGTDGMRGNYQSGY